MLMHIFQHAFISPLSEVISNNFAAMTALSRALGFRSDLLLANKRFNTISTFFQNSGSTFSNISSRYIHTVIVLVPLEYKTQRIDEKG